MDADSDSSWDKVQSEDAFSTETPQLPTTTLKKRKGWLSFLKIEDDYPEYKGTLPSDDKTPLHDVEYKESPDAKVTQKEHLHEEKEHDELLGEVAKPNSTDIQVSPVDSSEEEEREDSPLPVQLEATSTTSTTIPPDQTTPITEALNDKTPTVEMSLVLDDEQPLLEDASPLPELVVSTGQCVPQDVYPNSQLKFNNDCIIDIDRAEIEPEPSTVERLASTFVSDLWFWTTDIILSVSVISIMSCFTNLVWQADA